MAGVSARDPAIAARRLCRMTDAAVNRQYARGIRHGSGMAIAALDGETYQSNPISNPSPLRGALWLLWPYAGTRGYEGKGTAEG